MPQHASADVARARAPAQGADLVRRLADWLLRHLLPRGEAGDTIRGDLLEEWHARGGTRAASRLFLRHALSLSARYAWRRQRHFGPAAAGDRSHHMFLDNIRQDIRYALRS